MKLFVCIALAVNCVLGAHLGNSYIPPPSHAGSAGGSNFLQTPTHGAGAGFGSQFQATTSQFHSTGGAGGFGGAAAGAGHFGGQHFGGQQGGGQQSYQSSASQYSAGGHQQSSGQQIPIIRYDNSPNAGDGSFSYSYETGNGIKEDRQGQLKGQGIAIQGQFSYPGDDGQNYALTYTADENGYQPQGAHLPTPPPIPEAILKSLQIIAQSPPQGAHNGAYQHSNEGAYTHQGGQQQGGYGGQASFGGHQQQQGFGGHQQQAFAGHSAQHGSFGAASNQATKQHYLPPKQQSYSAQTGYQY